MIDIQQTSRALDLYRDAEKMVIAAGFAWETEWQRSREFKTLTERDLLRETAWVILCSGFREAVVRGLFDYISLCFCDWEAASEISARRQACIDTASSRFRNQRKLKALVDVADLIQLNGFEPMWQRLKSDPIRELQAFPFIGPVTSWHLAKNLGFNVAKNDRHLARLAVSNGYRSAHELCEEIASQTGELASVIDVVLWRFAALQSKTQKARQFC